MHHITQGSCPQRASRLGLFSPERVTLHACTQLRLTHSRNVKTENDPEFVLIFGWHPKGRLATYDSTISLAPFVAIADACPVIWITWNSTIDRAMH